MALARTQYRNRKNFLGFKDGKHVWKSKTRPPAPFVPNLNAANGEGDLHWEDGEKVPKLRIARALARAKRDGKPPRWKGQANAAQEAMQQQQDQAHNRENSHV